MTYQGGVDPDDCGYRASTNRIAWPLLWISVALALLCLAMGW
jgi:hypothetical protein